MSQNKIKLALAILAVTLLSSACSISTNSSSQNKTAPESDSSIFVTANSGTNWKVMTSMPIISGSPRNINDINVNLMTMDPQDSSAVYLASFDRGLFFTYNITEGWNQVKNLPSATVHDVKVDPKNKCTIYAAMANRLLRSKDCARTWTQIYFDNNPEVVVSAISIDYANSQNIYLGTTRGEIIKSIDAGDSWRTIKRLDAKIARLIISPQDSRLVFVATSNNKIFRFKSESVTNANNSADNERNFSVDDWYDLNDVLKDFNLGSNFRDFVVSAKDGSMFIATEKLILRSPDNGITWEDIKLIQPEKDAIINSLAVNPKDSQNFFYVTNTTFFSTTDGGVSWTTKKLPTSRAGRELLIDFNNPNIIYMGTVKLK